MKHAKKLLALLLAGVLLLSAMSVAAESSKVEQALKEMNEANNANGTQKAIYEDGSIIIENAGCEQSYSTMRYGYKGTVIEYDPGEITTYDEASDAIAHVMYAMKLIYAALELNGYTKEQIAAYSQSEDSRPTMETTGFELTPAGEAQEFTSDDGTATMTVTPTKVKIDVAAARLYAPGSDMAEPTDTTVQAVADHLNADRDFAGGDPMDPEDRVARPYDNSAQCDEDGTLTIFHTDYLFYNVYFDCEDGVLTYEAPEISDYDEAFDVTTHAFWAEVLMQYALKANGYTTEEYAAFVNTEGNGFDFDRNGIEFKELGETQAFDDESGTLYVAPISVKIDFNRANLKTADVSEASEEPKTEPVSPATGDGGFVAIMPAVCLMALAAAAFAAMNRRNKAEE